jgi:uncharacterized protein (DUF1800 family)
VKDIDLRLLRRVTLGADRQRRHGDQALASTATWPEQLTPSSIDDSACDTRIATRYPQFAYSQATLAARSRSSGTRWWPRCRAIVERGAFSKRQLQERMTEFWTDHFNIANSPPGWSTTAT